MQGVMTVDSGDLLDKAVQASGFGGSFAIVLVFLRWLLTFVVGRNDRREVALDARWAAYTKKIEERCERMEEEVEECHRHKHDLEIRIARLEGFDHGLGDRRQEEQRGVSARRVLGGDKV